MVDGIFCDVGFVYFYFAEMATTGALDAWTIQVVIMYMRVYIIVSMLLMCKASLAMRFLINMFVLLDE